MSSTTRRGESIASALATSSAIDARQTGEAFGLRQQLRLERLQARGQRRAALPNLTGADEPEGRVLGKPLGIVNILVPRQPTVYRLPHEVGQRQLGVLPSRVSQVPFDERAEAQPLIQLSHQEQAAVRSDARTLEVDLQPTIEQELKGLFLRLTHRRSTSAPRQSHPNLRLSGP
jgi:hypothetical protein